MIKVGLVQINSSYLKNVYFPYSVGILQVVAEKQFPNKYEFLLPIFRRVEVSKAVEDLKGADIVFFSLYIWSNNLSLEIAKRLKEVKPEITIVFGGPQVPSRNIENFLRKYYFVDLACLGEIEIAGPAILANEGKKIYGLPGVSFIEGDKFISMPEPERISDLNKIPSPYLEGIFDPLIKANQEVEWIPLWETNRGCPFSCAYCDWGSATKKKVLLFDLDRLFAEIDWFVKHRISFVCCCDSNFGMLERDYEIVKRMVDSKLKYGYPEIFSVQSTKNFKEHTYKINKLLIDNKLNKITTLAMQTLNEETLVDIKRKNIPIKQFEAIQYRLASEGLKTETDLIMGLPNESYDSYVNGIIKLLEMGQHNKIIVSELTILPNAAMGDEDYQKKYGFEIINTDTVNRHGSFEKNIIQETQKIVISTSTMPREDWIKARLFEWMVLLLHFDKLLQIPIIIFHVVNRINYRQIIEAFIESDLPIFSEIRKLFINKAKNIQNGGAVYCESKEWLNVWWPVDEFVFIKICVEYGLDKFYEEAENIFLNLLAKNYNNFDSGKQYLFPVLELNKKLIKLPNLKDDIYINTNYNVWEIYQNTLKGKKLPTLINSEYKYKIIRTGETWNTWEEWFKKVVWYSFKEGGYMYNCKVI